MKTMKKIILLLCAFLSMAVSAQEKNLTGLVCDDENVPISNATVIVSHNDSVVGLAESNDEGRFSIAGLPQNMKLGIYIHHLRYQTLTDSVDLGKGDFYLARMQEGSIELDSITVLGTRKPIRTPYGHIYFLSKKAAESGNPYKALEEIPKLQSNYITEDLNSADGKSILLLVDGSKVNTGLRPIDPSRIASVEVIDVVSSKYLRTGAGRIVNIHLKRSKTIYTYLRLGFGNTFPWKQGWTGPIMEVGNSKLSLYLELFPSWNRHDHSRTSVTTTTANYIRDIHGNDDSRMHDWDYTAMLKWRPTKNNYFIYSFQGYDSHSRSFANFEGTHEDLDAKAMMDYASQSAADMKSHVYTHTLYYKHDFSKSVTLDGTGRYTYNHNKQNSTESQTLSDYVVDSRQDLTTKRNAWSQELNLSWIINDKMSLDLGNATDYSTNTIHQTDNGSSYEFKGLNEYGYVSLAMNFSGLSTVISSGLDYMHLNSAGVKNHYIRPNASIDLSYEKGISTTSLSYFLTNTQPTIARLNPFNTSTDSLEHVSGNPMLVPERTHSLRLGQNFYSKGLNVNVEASYDYTKDIIQSASYYKDGVHYSTFSNSGQYHLFSLTGTVSYHHDGFTAGTALRWNVFDFENQKKKKNVILNLYARWYQKSFGIHSELSYTNKEFSVYRETRFHRPYQSNIAVSYNLTPNLIFILGCRNVYGKLKYESDYNVSGYHSFSKFKSTDSQVFFTVRWTFRKNGKDKIAIDEGRIKEHEKGVSL